MALLIFYGLQVALKEVLSFKGFKGFKSLGRFKDSDLNTCFSSKMSVWNHQISALGLVHRCDLFGLGGLGPPSSGARIRI